MSGSFSPDEGRDPCEGHDLDDLLSGKGGPFPEGLRRVAQTLDALRGAPMPAELSGEAAARAAFRKVMLPDESTLILPRGAADDGPYSVPGRHRHRRLPQRVRWQVKALVAAAAVVVIAGATAVASTLSSSGGRPAAAGSAVGATSTATHATSPGSHALQGSATPETTANPTPTSSEQSETGASSTELCHEYFGFFADPGQQSNSTEEDVLGQLSSRADGASGVYYYCVRNLQPWAAPQRPGSSPDMRGYPIPGDLPGQSGSQESQGAGQSGHGGNGGKGNNGNGQGKSGSGFGGQH